MSSVIKTVDVLVKPVVTGSVIVKQHPAFVCAKRMGNFVEGLVERTEVAVQFVDREITGEHASRDPKGLNGLEDEWADGFHRPFPIGRSQPCDLDHDIRSIR